MNSYQFLMSEVDQIKRKYQETNEQLRFLMTALDRLSNPIFIKDERARFVFFNKSYADAFGMSREEYIGKTVMELDYLPEVDRQVYQAEDERLIRTGQVISREVDFTFSDGVRHSSLYWSTGVRDEESGRCGVIGEIVDISKQRDIQHKLDSAVRELRRVNDRLQEMAVLDAGTGIFNRTMLNQKEKELIKSEIGDAGCALMCDLDHFKRVNDKFGHVEGDSVLSQFANILKLECRRDDLPVRYGGEEFLVFLNQCSLSIGQSVAERIRQRCESEIRLPDGDAITVSIGVGRIDGHKTLMENIRMLDRFLYQAKERGRNCVVTEELHGRT